MRWVLRIAINAVAIWVATAIVPGVHLTAADNGHKVLAFAVVGALFGIVNTVIRPVVRLVTFPFILLTLGLLLVVINAFMLKLVDWLSGAIGIDFSAGPFWWSTIGAAVVVSLVSMILGVVLGDRKGDDGRRRRSDVHVHVNPHPQALPPGYQPGGPQGQRRDYGQY